MQQQNYNFYTNSLQIILFKKTLHDQCKIKNCKILKGTTRCNYTSPTQQCLMLSRSKFGIKTT